MRILTVGSAGDALAARERYDGEDLVLTPLSVGQLKSRFRAVTTGIFDFDGTLTMGRNQFMAMQELLPADLSRDEELDRDWFFSGQADFGPSDMSHNDWWLEDATTRDENAATASLITRSIMRWAMAGLTDEDVKRVGAAMTLREGLFKIFSKLRRRLIVTCGVEQLVESALRQNTLGAHVAGFRLIFNPDGRIRSHHPKPVSVMVKGRIADLFCRRENVDREHVMTVGDTIIDVEMMNDRGVNVLIMPPGEINAKIAANRESCLRVMFGRLSCVVISDSLHPIAALLPS